MKCPRWTIRRMMAFVLILAVMLGLGLPAWHVYHKPEFHAHAWIDRLDPDHSQPTYMSSVEKMFTKGKPVVLPAVTKVTYRTSIDPYIPTSFWHRYWNCLLPNSGITQTGCRPIGTQVQLMCEFDHPEICHRKANGLIGSVGLPNALLQKANRLNGEVPNP